MKKDKKEKISAKVFRNNAYMMKLAWQISRGRIVVRFIDNLLDMVNWAFAAVVFMRLIINGLERGAGFGEITVIIALSTVAFVVIALFRSWSFYKYYPEAELRAGEKLYAMLFDQSANVELACYEDPEFYNKYTLAVKEAGDRLGSVINSFCELVNLPLSMAYESIKCF